MNNELTEIEYRVLRVTPKQDAYWTKDIALDAKVSTDTARRVLIRLEKYGEVMRVATGSATSWRQTPDVS